MSLWTGGCLCAKQYWALVGFSLKHRKAMKELNDFLDIGEAALLSVAVNAMCTNEMFGSSRDYDLSPEVMQHFLRHPQVD